MRIDENIKRNGYFWLPGKPDRKIPGILLITDGGNISLEILDMFDNSPKGLKDALSGGNEDIDRINGFVEESGYVTLDDCFYTKRNISFGSISKSIICINKALFGVAFEKDEELLFNSFLFSVEGIDDWIGISGIKVDHDIENKSAKIEYKPPQEISISLNNGMILQITFMWKLPGFPSNKEAIISQKVYFKLISDIKLRLGDFISVSHKITALLGFAIDKTVSIEKVSANSNSLKRKMGDDKYFPIQIKVYYSSILYLSEIPKISVHDMLFRYIHIQNDFENKVNNWLIAYDHINPTLSLYFSTKIGAQRHVDGKIIALVQALESYHRRTETEKIIPEDEYKILVNTLLNSCPDHRKEWLTSRLAYGNEMSLRNRLKNIIEPFKDIIGTNKERRKLISNIVNTRNYLTHYDQSLEDFALNGLELWQLSIKIEAIIQLHLLIILGFTMEEIQSVYNNSYMLKEKLKST
ncbi:MAG: hypothetical protein HQ528_10610 [Candidatus Marinimicrobia bacterium]|nr:hypothetical protein [Candidatus Neomarinimicrobiota bacterium]